MVQPFPLQCCDFIDFICTSRYTDKRNGCIVERSIDVKESTWCYLFRIEGIASAIFLDNDRGSLRVLVNVYRRYKPSGLTDCHEMFTWYVLLWEVEPYYFWATSSCDLDRIICILFSCSDRFLFLDGFFYKRSIASLYSFHYWHWWHFVKKFLGSFFIYVGHQN